MLPIMLAAVVGLAARAAEAALIKRKLAQGTEQPTTPVRRSLEQLNQVVVSKLADEPSLELLSEEFARTGQASARTLERVYRALEDAAENDSEFATVVTGIVEEIRPTVEPAYLKIVAHGTGPADSRVGAIGGVPLVAAIGGAIGSYVGAIGGVPLVAQRNELMGAESRLSIMPVTIYVSDEMAASQVESAVDDLIASVGLDVEKRDDPVLGSWFRRIWVRVRNSAHSPLIHDVAASTAHAADSRLVLSQDATVTATMMQNLGPVLTALQPTRDACIRVGALLIVKVDWVVSIHQLTAAQQLHLDHQPNLATAPHKVIQALKLEQVDPPEKAPKYIDVSIPSQTLVNPKIDNT